MLKYTYGNADLGTTTNRERLFVHRVHDSGQNIHGNDAHHSLDMNASSSPTTFWKSPYAGDNSIFRSSIQNSKSVCLRPEVNVSPSKITPKLPNNEPRPVNVKGILKNKLKQEVEPDVTSDEKTTRVGQETVHLITTGTGKGRPHMPGLRSKSAGKRVQFNGLPKGLHNERKTLDVGNAGQETNFKLPVGRRLYQTSKTRTLGTRQAIHPPTCGRFYGSIAVSSINGGESQIKNQINEFVKRLRLAESEKLARAERASSAKTETDAGKASAERFRRTRCKSSVNRFHDWSEFDMDKPKSPGPEEDTADAATRKKGTKVIYNVFHSRNSDVNNEDSTSSIDSVKTRSASAEDTAATASAQSAVRMKIIRAKPLASLYTKYSHITTNYINLNKYGTNARTAQNRLRSSISTSTQNQSTNFCDRTKTSQILGWLEEVKNAQSTDGNQPPNDAAHSVTK